MIRKRKHYEAQYRLECRGILRDIKSRGCSICGYNKCVDSIDFHHISLKNNRERDISSMVSKINSRVGIRRIIKEVSKCIIVCSNCHREIHSNIGDLRNHERSREESPQLSIPFIATA